MNFVSCVFVLETGFIFVKTGDVGGALSWLEESQRRGINCDVAMYATMIDAFVRSNELRGAVVAYESMRSEGLEGDVKVRSTVLNVYAKMKDLAMAKTVFQRMKDVSLMAQRNLFTATRCDSTGLIVSLTRRIRTSAQAIAES